MRAAAEAAAQQSSEINATIRAELARGVSWWHWRHLLGYVLILQILALTFATFKDLLVNDYTGVQQAIALLGALTTILIGEFALLGYVAQDTTKRATVAATGEHPGGIMDAIGKVIAGVRR